MSETKAKGKSPLENTPDRRVDGVFRRTNVRADASLPNVLLDSLSCAMASDFGVLRPKTAHMACIQNIFGAK